MKNLELLERQVEQLSTEELAQFRDWFLEFEWQVWDRQVERDSKAEKLDKLAEKALEDHAAGRTKPL